MRYWILIPLLWPSLSAGAINCDPVDMANLQQEIGRINERYDDFFRYQQKREAHEEHLQTGVEEVKAQRELREKELERARAAYRAVPKDYAKEEALRIEWEAAQKGKTKQLELARLCEVQQREKAIEILKKGRKIPEVKEFDLGDAVGE